MGAIDATMTVALEARIANNTLHFLEEAAILPDLVDGKLPSRFASVTVRNEGDDWMELCNYGLNQVPICLILPSLIQHLTHGQAVQTGIEPTTDGRVRIAPGQSRPIGFRIESVDNESSRFTKSFSFRKAGTDSACEIEALTLKLVRRSRSEPHKLTFLHPSGVVSYAIMMPPSDCGTRDSSETSFPVLLNLHGAGLEADSHQVRHMLDSVHDIHAWTLFPTGMSPWSGDDWHTWGFADVRAAIFAISDWVDAMSWEGPGVLTDRWFLSGHSNGGQGVWYILSHQPDHVLAAAAASGYLSIQTYVPYSMWRQAPPLLTAVLHQAMASFRHELLTENMASTPTILQHGSDDDNVPPYHSRLMNSLLREIDADVNYVELPNKGHWFEGAMATKALQAFYHQHLPMIANANQPPVAFSAVFPSTDDMGSRWGIVMDQAESSDLFGRVEVLRSGSIWRLSTTNVHRLHFDFASNHIEPPATVILDGNEVEWAEKGDPIVATSFVKSGDGSWGLEVAEKWRTLLQRFGRQRGALDAIMRTVGAFEVVTSSERTFDAALQISRNLYQYYGADSSISHSSREVAQAGNLITLAVGTDLSPGELEPFPLRILPTGIEVRRSNRSRTKIIPMETGLGAVFLRPLRNERLELVVWGADESGLRQAARLVPTLTGVGQADFIILNKRAAWQGHAGAIAMGFFDFEWQISEGSYIS
jgi:predicted esterase